MPVPLGGQEADSSKLMSMIFDCKKPNLGQSPSTPVPLAGRTDLTTLTVPFFGSVCLDFVYRCMILFAFTYFCMLLHAFICLLACFCLLLLAFA